MSIIHKALKRAEDSKTGKRPEEKSHSYIIESKSALRIIVISFIGMVLLFSIGIYWFRGRPLPVATTPAKDVSVEKIKPENIPTEKEAERAAPVDAPDVLRLHEEAIKEIIGRNYSGAEGILRKALLIRPDDPELHNHLGLALKNQSKYKEASAEYEKALQLKPDYHEAMNNLAVTSEMLGNKDRANALYKKALSLKPSYTEAHLNYALLLESEGKNSEAESHYHTFLNLSSDEDLKKKVKERIRALKK